MAKVRFKASQEDFEKAGKDLGDFVVPKPGLYVMTCTEVNAGYSKKKDSDEEDKSKPRLEMIYAITGIGKEEAQPKENYGSIWDYVSFSNESGWKRAEVAIAYGFAEPGTTEFDDDIDTDEMINRKVLARLKHEKGRTKDDKPRAKVARLFPYGSDPGAEEMDVSYGSEESTFGSTEDDPFGEAEPDVEPHTEESLNELDLKALGAVLKEEFEGEPTEHIVKVKGKLDAEKTKAAVIAAILAAQEEVGTEEDSEDPF